MTSISKITTAITPLEEVNKINEIIDALGSAGHNLFDNKWCDYIILDQSWLRADTFSWQDGTVYSNAYNHLVNDIQGKSASTETVNGTTVTYYLADDGHKIVLAANVSAIETVYSSTGVAWYYVLDTTNQRFKLPRELPITDKIKGNGKAVGFTNGNQEFALYNGGIGTDGVLQPSVSTLPIDIGQTRGSYPTIAATAGIVADKTKSGIISHRENTNGQQYLYFYVGEFSQSATEQTAGLNSELFNGKMDRDMSNMNASATAKETIVGWGMPDYSRGITFAATTPIQAPYDCVVFWNASASTSNPAYFMISPTGAFTTEFLTYVHYVNTDGYETKTFFIPKGWYFYATRTYDILSISPSQYFPMKGV